VLWVARVVRRLLARIFRPVKGILTRVFADLHASERFLLLGIAVLHVIGIGWGLPASDGWDVDGVAPRDFLPGIIKTYTPGDYFTYPPLHLLVLTVLTLPATLLALLRAPSLSQHDVIQTFLNVPVMTTFAYVARVVSLLMSLGIVLAVGRLAGAVFGPRARPWAMAIAGVEVAGTYYAHTSNLDIPALFWASHALLTLVEAVKADDPRRLRRVGVLAACAIATKDQAYAIFLLSLPCVLIAWAALRRREGTLRPLLRETAWLVGIGVVLVLVLDAAVFNPTGFAARVRFLTGPASQDFAQYSRDWPGRLAALREAVTFLPNHYPVALAPVFALGVVFAIKRAPGRDRIAALVPLLAIVSFTLAFNCVARRVEERFMLPQMQLLAVYGGGAIAGLLELVPVVQRRALTWMVRAGAAACVLSGLRMSAALIATMLGDTRYDAEAYMREHVQPGEVIEVYGNNVYLPRFPEGAVVHRIDSRPTDNRNPMLGVIEKEDQYGNVLARSPRWIVLSSGYFWRFLPRDPKSTEGGHVLPESQRILLADSDATTHMRGLFSQTAGYRVAHISHYAGHPLLPPRAIHASLACDVWIFERQ
jgi:hypothetical protein